MVDFWRLIWQEKPPTIVMVTNLKESNKKKCEQYWPESGSTTFGPFKVTLTEHQVFADYCIRTMQVSVSTKTRPKNNETVVFLRRMVCLGRLPCLYTVLLTRLAASLGHWATGSLKMGVYVCIIVYVCIVCEKTLKAHI